MNRGRVGEERGSKETDGCPLTGTSDLVILAVTWVRGWRMSGSSFKRICRSRRGLPRT
jgi:hypothetical protein